MYQWIQGWIKIIQIGTAGFLPAIYRYYLPIFGQPRSHHGQLLLHGSTCKRDMWCSVANYHLRNILKIRKYLTQDFAQILIHAFISSKLDYCNSLLYGIPKYLVCRLQRVQNTAARIVTLAGKYDLLTPIMFKLHWLPVHVLFLSSCY